MLTKKIVSYGKNGEIMMKLTYSFKSNYFINVINEVYNIIFIEVLIIVA